MVAEVRQFMRGGRARPTGPFTAAHVTARTAALAAALALTLGPVGGAQALEVPPDPDPAPAARPAPASTPGPASATTQPATSTPPATQPAPNTQPTPSTAQASTSGPTETVIEEDDGADVGRHNRLRLFYFELSGGYSWVKLGLLRESNLVPEIARLNESGFTVGGGLGFFIKFLTLGLQGQVARHDSFDLGTVMLDLGIRLPTRTLEPYFRFGIGYAWLFNNAAMYGGATVPSGALNIRGVAANLGFGFDYMITRAVAIGVGADATVFNVRRGGVSGAPIISGIDVDLSEEGDAVGVQISALVQLSFHF
jgi:hypothetical protein